MRAGIDTGGTFTDCIVIHHQQVVVYKTLSNPESPARAVLKGLEALAQALGPAELSELVHGTTVATNALLERKVARICLLITQGFKDLLLIGRQNRPDLYDLSPRAQAPLYASVLEIPERISAQGEIIQALSPQAIERLIAEIPPETEALAVCCLFGYAWPEHERLLAQALRARGWRVSASHEVMPVYREYERFSSTVANASLQPIMQGYMQELITELQGLDCRLMQSNGGSLRPELVARQPIRCALSGPAGGVKGALMLGQLIRQTRLLSFDMGGTSTDVALIDGSLPLRNESQINGIALALPMLDIHTVGAGGGSLVELDAGGALSVGPASAGADPGPVCYGKGSQLTVSDANVFLGRIPADSRLGGQLSLDTESVSRAFEALARELELSPEEAALGVLAVANASMERALRTVSVERGYDPADYSLFCFGGAGGLHACELALSLNISEIIVPVHAGVFSALGMLYAAQIEDLSQTVLGSLPAEALSQQPQRIQKAFEQLAERLEPVEQAEFEYQVDLRYSGQSFEISVPWQPQHSAASLSAFHQAHERLHGYARPQAALELVSLKLSRTVSEAPPELPCWPSQALAEPRMRQVYLKRWQAIPSWQRSELSVAQVIPGPALILEETSTTLIGPEFVAQLDHWGNLIMRLKNERD